MSPQRRRYLIFGILGILLYLLASWVLYYFLDRSLNWENSRGVLTGFVEQEGLESRYDRYPTVAFLYQGDTIRFTSRFGGSDIDTLKPGRSLPIYFPKGQPKLAEIRTPAHYFFPMTIYFFSVVFGGIGFSGFFLLKKAKRLGARYDLYERRKGKKLSSTIVGVSQNNSAIENGVDTFVITAQWQDPKEEIVYQFTSDAIWYDPTPLLAGRKNVDVYVDQKDMNRYHVDLKFLPAIPIPSKLKNIHEEAPIQT